MREELGLFVKGVALVMVLRCRMMPGEQDSRSEMGIELCSRVEWVGGARHELETLLESARE
jgi:hypothetical protein